MGNFVVPSYNARMPICDDYDDVTTRPKVRAEQHGNTDQERNQRTRTLLEIRKDAILDAMRDPDVGDAERRALLSRRDEIKSDIRAIKYGAPVSLLRELERKWR